MKKITLRSKTDVNGKTLKVKISGDDVVINKFIRWFKDYNYEDKHLSRYDDYVFNNPLTIKTSVIKARKMELLVVVPK